jgi:hypothetical protein
MRWFAASSIKAGRSRVDRGQSVRCTPNDLLSSILLSATPLSAARLNASLRFTAHCNSPRLSSIATHVATSNGTPRRLVSALPSASRRCSTPRNATPRSAPLLASSRLCSAHLISTQRNAAMLGSGSALFRSTRRTAPQLNSSLLISTQRSTSCYRPFTPPAGSRS